MNFIKGGQQDIRNDVQILAARGSRKVEATLQNTGMGSDQKLKSLTVASNGHEMPIPEHALEGIKRPLTDTLEITVEPDKIGQPTLCISFNLGKPDAVAPERSPKRLSYCFQNRKFLNRITTTTLTKVVDQWNP